MRTAATSLALLGSMATLGACTDITAGQNPPDTTPPRVLKVMVQDDGQTRFNQVAGRGLDVNILNTTGAGPACDDGNPCPLSQWNINPTCGTIEGGPTGNAAEDAAHAANACSVAMNNCHCWDPESAKNVPPPVGVPLRAAGAQIRVVFSKAVDMTKLETIYKGTCSMSGGPCNTATASTDCTMGAGDMCKVIPGTPSTGFTLQAGLVDLLGPDGKSVDEEPGYPLYDLEGNPNVSSDQNNSPYGPALEILPAQPLQAGVQYTVVLKSGLIKDYQGQGLTDASGMMLGATTMYSFTVEPVAVMQPWNCPSGLCLTSFGTFDYPDVSSPAPDNPAAYINPSDAIQLQLTADAGEPITTNPKADATKASSYVATTMAMLKGMGGTKDIPNCDMAGVTGMCVEAFLDTGGTVPCAMGLVPQCMGTGGAGQCALVRTLDIVVETAPHSGMAAKIPEGLYTLTVSGVTSATGASMMTPFSQTIGVSASMVAMPALPASGLATPEACAMAGGGMGGSDGNHG